MKPNTGHTVAPSAPYQRNDDFSGPGLANVWQWNHVPVDDRWSLAERPGFLRLHSLPAPDFWWARNTLTQRAIGPVSIPTVELDASGLRPGDVAGLALLNLPYGWIGVRRDEQGLTLEQFNQLTGETERVPLNSPRVSLRAHCNFLTEQAMFSYRTDGVAFTPIGTAFTMIFQLKTFQGVRYSLFHYNATGAPGGHAEFDRFTVEEPHPRGLMRPIPRDRTITLTPWGAGVALSVQGASEFRVVDRGLGRVALQAGDRFLSVPTKDGGSPVTLKAGEPGEAETFQWTENVYGDLNLLSLLTHRHIRADTKTGGVFADSPGPKPDRQDGSCLVWQ